MKNYIRIISLSFCWTFLQSCTSPETDSGSLKELEITLEKFNGAFRNYDTKELEELVADNYLHVNGTSSPISKQAWINYIRSRAEKVEDGNLLVSSYEFTEVQIKKYGSSAFVTGKIKAEGIEDGIPFSTSLRVTSMWVYEGKWRRAGFQDSRLI